MARFLGVEGGHISKKGGPGSYDPPDHKGLDVWAAPGSPVHVPLNADRLVIVRSNFEARGQGFGWISFCGNRYGFALAHLASQPRVDFYEPGDLIGHVAGRTPWTPHVHWAFARGFIPPEENLSNLNPLKVWEGCKRS